MAQKALYYILSTFAKISHCFILYLCTPPNIIYVVIFIFHFKLNMLKAICNRNRKVKATSLENVSVM